MAIKRKSTTQLQRTKGLDFLCPDDEAWYSVRLLKIDEGRLRVMYAHFPEEHDEFYFHDQFKSLDEIDEMLGRFRRPAEQLQDSQCREVTPGMVVLACDTFSSGTILFFDAVVDSVRRCVRKSHGTSEEQVCTCQFQVTWRDGPATAKHATVSIGSICLIQDSQLHDPVLLDFIVSARKFVENRIGNFANQEGDVGLNFPASSAGASSHPADVPVLTDLKCPDIFHHNKRELSVSSQVVLFPGLLLSNTASGAIYVQSKQHVLRLLTFLNSPDNIIVSKKGRPWVFNKKSCSIHHSPMLYQEMNLDTGYQDDATGIRVLHPGSEGFEEARKMRSLFEAHYDHIEILNECLRNEELKLNNTTANGSRAHPSSSK